MCVHVVHKFKWPVHRHMRMCVERLFMNRKQYYTNTASSSSNNSQTKITYPKSKRKILRERERERRRTKKGIIYKRCIRNNNVLYLIREWANVVYVWCVLIWTFMPFACQKRRKEEERNNHTLTVTNARTHTPANFYWILTCARGVDTCESAFSFGRAISFLPIVHGFQFLFWFLTQLLSRWTSLPIIFRTTWMLLSAICSLSPSHTLFCSYLARFDCKWVWLLVAYTPSYTHSHITHDTSTHWVAERTRAYENICCGSRFINCKAPTDIESPLHTNLSHRHHINECINHFASLGMPMRAFCTIISISTHSIRSSNAQLVRLTIALKSIAMFGLGFIQIELLISIEFFMCSPGCFARWVDCLRRSYEVAIYIMQSIKIYI